MSLKVKRNYLEIHSIDELIDVKIENVMEELNKRKK